jgi:hypothetical protein
LGNLSTGETTYKLIIIGNVSHTRKFVLLKDGNILVSKATEKRGAGDRGGTTTDESDFGLVARRKLGNWWETRIADLRDLHSLENFTCELLKSSNV